MSLVGGYILTEIVENSNAVVWCGYPGCEGGKAIYDTLFGKKNNFGRLSFSLPLSVGQLPVCYNFKDSRPYVDMTQKPLFSFGYGLSYSKFEYFNFSVKEIGLKEIVDGGFIEVSFTVKNISACVGKAVPQLYINRSGGTVSHRVKELRGFDKVELQPNEEKTITFTLGFDELKEWSAYRKYELYPCKLTIMLGNASDDIVYEKVIDIK